MPKHEVAFICNGQRHTGVMKAEMSLALEGLAHAFNFDYAERVDPQDRRKLFWLEAQDWIEIQVDGETLLDGWIDEARASRVWDRRDFQVWGRAASADLVDCVIEGHNQQHWENAKPSDIIEQLVEPFGFTVSVDSNAEDLDRSLRGRRRTQEQAQRAAARMANRRQGRNPCVCSTPRSAVAPPTPPPVQPSPAQVRAALVVPSFTVKDGETVFEAIRRLCEMRGLWPAYDYGKILRLTAPQRVEPRGVLEIGSNVLSIDWKTDFTQRFSEYHIRGCSRATDTVFGRAAVQHNGEVYDKTIRRYRPTRVQKSGSSGSGDAGDRGIRERNQRAGDSETVGLVIDGWTNDDGQLYRPGQSYAIRDELLRFDDEVMVVADVAYNLTASEAFVAKVTMKRHETYQLDAEYPPRQLRGEWAR